MNDDRNLEEIKAMAVTKAISLNGLNPFPKNPFKIPLGSIRNMAITAMNIANTTGQGYSFAIEEMLEAVKKRGYDYKDVYTFSEKPEALEPGEKEEMVSSPASTEKVTAKAVPEKVEIPAPAPPEKKGMIEISPIPSQVDKGGAANIPEEEGTPLFVDLMPIQYATVVELLLKAVGDTLGRTLSDALKKFNVKADPEIKIRAEPDLANRNAKFILEVIVRF